MDPRGYAIKKRLQNIERILSIVSGKGGVGKSTIASILSLALIDKGYKVGLLDLDFHGPSCHIILGISDFTYEEEHGIKPYIHEGISFASIYPFVKEEPVSLRGMDMSNAITEFLAILNWSPLDFLVIDMPPSMGDPFLDIVKYIPNAEHIIITTSSRLSTATVSRLIKYLQEQNYSIVGLIENMSTHKQDEARKLAEHYGIRHLCVIPYDETLEESLGHPKRLRHTRVYNELSKIIEAIT